MSSLVYNIGGKNRAVGRFIGRVHRELQKAVAEEKQTRGLTQQQRADMLDTEKSVINRQIRGANLTLRRLAEFAWALGWEIAFEFRKRPVSQGQNQSSDEAFAVETSGTSKVEVRAAA